MADKKIFSLHNAHVYPLCGTMDRFQAGVFEKGQLVPCSLLPRAVAASPAPMQDTVHGTCLFGGYLFGHFGHFVLESLSRLYAFKACKKVPIVFSTPNDTVYAWQKRILRFLKVENEVIVLRHPAVIEHLLMSEDGCTLYPPFISQEQLLAMGVSHLRSSTSPKKIWLSRTRVPGGGVEEEAEIERIIVRLGWHIVHPQELSIQQQTLLVSSADFVAGFDGSAFYSVLFARRVHGHFLIFSRRNVAVKMLTHILLQKGISFKNHIFPVQWVSGEEALARFSMPDYAQVVEVLAAAVH